MQDRVPVMMNVRVSLPPVEDVVGRVDGIDEVSNVRLQEANNAHNLELIPACAAWQRLRM